jgi:translation initiation factor IF-2
MTDENDSGRPSPAPGVRAPLTLKPRIGGAVSAGMVKQSFSHGRSKTVVVETKRRRVDAPVPAGGAERRAAFEVRGVTPPRPAPAAPPPAPADAHGLSEDERRARQRVIEEARRAQERAAAERASRSPVSAPAAAPAPVSSPPVSGEAEPTSAQPAEAAPEAPAIVAEPVLTEAARPEPAKVEPARPQRPVEPVRTAPESREVSRDTSRDARPAAARPTAPGQTRTYEPGRERRDDRPTTTTYRPDQPGGGVAFNQRAARSDDGFAPRGRGDETRETAAGQRERPSRPGETVRYSATAARPARDGARPAGPRGPNLRPAAAPAEPEFQRASRQAPRPGSLNLDRRPDFDDEDSRKAKASVGKAVSRTRGEPKRREGRLTIQAVAGDDEGAVERMRSLASVRRAREREREKRRGGAQESAKTAREVVIPDVITVQELAGRMAIRAVEIIKFLAREGVMLKALDVIESDTAELVATEFGHTVRRVSESDVETGFLAEEDVDDHLLPRPPVITIMGHVDHGKTSLLDALRSTDVAGGEHGGITQHIGAYQVRLSDGERVTFLDTPGHAAFSAMRARGANITDIVVLVVAADDGVMPQTIEAIQHARAADAPIIVAINKIDKQGADPNRVINELLQHEVVVERLGGDTQAVEVSATQKTGLDDLLEAILLQAQVMELKANPDRTAEGVVIESKLDRGRGAVATVLVRRGTLKRGEIVVAGAQFGRVRALLNERDEQLDSAGPSTPVEILGLDGAPDPGEPFAVVENEARARELTDYRVRLKRERSLSPVGAGGSLADMMAKLANKKVSELPLVLKADVQGSAEAIVGALDKMGTDEVRARIILSGAGGINESDVMLAKGAGASILGFNVRASKQARDLAEHEGVEIRYYAVIYDLIDDIRGVLSGLLAPIQRETFLGSAEVLQAFDISKVGRIAGCRVREGVVRRGARVRIIRDDVVVLELGTLQTLKRFKDEVPEVQAGQECGMAFAGFQDIKPGDQIECFTVEEVKRSL